MSQPFFARRSFVILTVVTFLLPFIWMGAVRALLSNRNDVKDWLPDDFEETAVHSWFQEHFPHEQFVLASWEGCTLDDQRLDLLAKKLVPPKEQPDADAVKPAADTAGGRAASDEPQYFKSVITGRSLVEDLRSRYPDLSEEEILTRLEGSLIGKDHNKTCLVVTLTKEAHGKNLRPMLAKIRELARECNIEPPEKAAESNPLVFVVDGLAQVGSEMIFGRVPKQDGIRLGGPPVDNVAIDVEGERTLFRLAGLSAIVGLGISYLVFRSIRLTFMVFATALLSAGLGLAIVFFSGGTCDAVLLSMPSLVYVLAISGSIHIVNYYHDAVRDRGLVGAPDRALAHGFWPCTIAALTTALGLGSLVVSHVVPISKFGIYSAIGVLATLLLVFFMLPSMLQLYDVYGRLLHGLVTRVLPFPGVKAYADRRLNAPKAVSKHDENAPQTRILRFWRAVGAGVVNHNKLVAAGCLAVMVFFAVGATQVKTSIKLMKLFSSDAQIIADYGWLEEHIGPLVPMEVVVKFDNQKCDLNMLERMRMIRYVERAVESLPAVGGGLSAATFAPDISPDTRPSGATRFFGIDRGRTRDYVLNKRLEEHRPEFREYIGIDDAVALEKAGHDPTLEQLGITGNPAEVLASRKLTTLTALEEYAGEKPLAEGLEVVRGLSAEQVEEIAQKARQWRTAHGDELWRVTARVEALSDLDYGLFVGDLKEKVEPVLQAFREQRGVEGVEAVYTGMVPLVYKTQRELMTGLFESLALAFVLIAFVMMAVLKSPGGGMLSMVPNLFPVLIIFGFMGWTGILVDIGSMMTASVALGVAVDDTIHFLAWFRRGLDRGLERKAAVMAAYERCATAMSQTTLIGGLGLAVFAFSTFTPTQRFGMLMLMLLFAALIGDLIFLPALLAGPLGRVFRRKKTAAGDDDRNLPQSATAVVPDADGAEIAPGKEEVAVSGDGKATAHSLRHDGAHRPRCTEAEKTR